MKTPRLGCERPAGEHDKLEFVRIIIESVFYTTEIIRRM